jgi:hypothetical protein
MLHKIVDLTCLILFTILFVYIFIDMTHRFNAESTSHEVARRGLPEIGERVWCSAPQKEEHLAEIMEYRHNFTEVLVKWDWDTGKEWEHGTWLDINFVRTTKSDDT